ncbi:hypothetical protein LUZ62_080863 [Rhynchospora pubera]|uniref:Uncharacterized protein n=1 Tax=Rhynchospora pubera TaxID=906938 RepID=A0AAV8BTF1_9POAL|nr:hypothetical protein LUZ62_080863 [Rhynchospora pubera]
MASPATQPEISPETARESLMEISKVTPETYPSNTTEASTQLPNGDAENGAEKKYRSKLISISYTQPTPCPAGNDST